MDNAIIKQIKKLNFNKILCDSNRKYLISLHNLLLNRIEIYENFDENRFERMSFSDLYEENRNFYREVNDFYYNSYANPLFTKKRLSEQVSDLASSIYQETIRSIQYIFQGNDDLFEILLKKFLAFYQNIDSDDIYSVMKKINQDNLLKFYQKDIEETYFVSNFASNLIKNNNLTDIRYLFRYGICITDTEIEFAKLLKKLDDAQITDLASQMVYGYLKGFKRHNKKMKNRKNSKIVLLVGLEKIAKKIDDLLLNEGYIGYIGEIVYRNLLSQANFDFKEINCLALDEEYFISDFKAYREVLKSNENILKSYQGNIIMVGFGYENRKLLEYKPYICQLYELKKNIN